MDLKKLWNVVKSLSPVIATLFSAYMTNIMPFSASFIPDDKAYGISLTLYSGIYLLTAQATDWFLRYIDRINSIVNVEYSIIESDFSQDEIIRCGFKQDTAKVFAKISMNGDPKKILHSIIELNLPVQVTAQGMVKYSKYYTITDGKKTIEVDLKKLLNDKKTKHINDSVVIGFVVIKNDETVESYIETTYKNTANKKVKLKNNKLKFTK